MLVRDDTLEIEGVSFGEGESVEAVDSEKDAPTEVEKVGDVKCDMLPRIEAEEETDTWAIV